MTANTGTVLGTPRWIPGATFTIRGYGTFTGTLTTGDTLTFTDMLPTNGIAIQSFLLYGNELDTNASPTATVVVGDGTDTDFYLASKTAGDATGQMQFFGDGVGLTTSYGTYPASNDVVVTAGGTVGTGASSAVVHVVITYVCDDAQQ